MSNPTTYCSLQWLNATKPKERNFFPIQYILQIQCTGLDVHINQIMKITSIKELNKTALGYHMFNAFLL